MNVILTGFRCSGKSSVGKELAARLGREFIDCDAFIERQTGLTIREIFERHGESHFRVIESQALAELAKLDGRVIATGGGAVLKHKNMQALKRNGVVFHLGVAAETAFRRMKEDPATPERRPPLTGGDPFAEMKEQVECRKAYYAESADVTIATDGKRLEDVVAEILTHLKDRGFPERSDMDAAPA
jgi:shikimate kinase